MMIQNTRIKLAPMGSSTDFILTVVVGNAQPSGTNIFLKGNLIHSANDNFTKPINEIKRGDELLVVTTVSDLPQNPNRISVQHSINNVANTSASFDDAVSEGEVAINTTRFIFY